MFFFFFFFPAWNQEGYFILLRSMKMKGEEGGWEGEMAAQIRGAVTPNLGKQIKYKLHMAAGFWWRVAVVWFGAQRVCGSCRGGSVTWAICEPQDRWGDAPRECEVDFIIPYPIPVPLVVSATPAPPRKPLEPEAVMYLFGPVDLSRVDIKAEQQAVEWQQPTIWSIINFTVKSCL